MLKKTNGQTGSLRVCNINLCPKSPKFVFLNLAKLKNKNKILGAEENSLRQNNKLV